MRIAVTGVAGSVGGRVAERLVEADGINVVGIDRVPTDQSGLADQHLGDLRTLDLDAIFADVDIVVHLASAYGRNEFVDASSHDTRMSRMVLEASERAQVRRVVVLSSAMVYGARAENPIPLTEQAPIGPNELAFAENKVSLELMAGDWVERSGGQITIVRPTTAVAARGSSWVARSLQLAAGLGSDANPPLQFLHLDDLADAVVLLVQTETSGVFNVSPDGWVRADDVRQLSGRTPRLAIPGPVAAQLVRLSWNAGIVATPPGIMPYATEPWVVANDKLRALGWAPQWTNEEAYVDGIDPRPWAMVNAHRRQQLALGGVTAGLVGAAALARRLRGR